jgi:hypothetical protein
MPISAKILVDALSPAGFRLTTFLVRCPRYILAEINTHRALSKNTASSRAIPVVKRARQVLEDPVRPVFTSSLLGERKPRKLGRSGPRGSGPHRQRPPSALAPASLFG